MVADSGWNELALKAVYWQGLNPDVLIELTCRDNAASLDSLIDPSIKLDNLLQDHHSLQHPTAQQQTQKTTMEVQGVRLSNSEHEHYHKEHLCFYRESANQEISQCISPDWLSNSGQLDRPCHCYSTKYAFG